MGLIVTAHARTVCHNSRARNKYGVVSRNLIKGHILTQSQVDDSDVVSVLLSHKLFSFLLSTYFILYSFYIITTVL